MWTKIADEKPAWAKKGEHLGALPAIKRLWPTLFAEEVYAAIGRDIGRFVVSTHTMALAYQIDRWLKRGGLTTEDFSKSCDKVKIESVALPRRIVLGYQDNPALKVAKRLPFLLDVARESDDEKAYEHAKKLVSATLVKGIEDKEEIKLETYYALLLMDGDRMGKILSGEDEKTAITYRESFHPQVQRGFDVHAEKQAHIKDYGSQKRAVSPGRHLAISSSLNDFLQTVARYVVEEEHLGRVIYSGGDDVLAMLPVADLLSAMQRLRDAYCGAVPKDEKVDWGDLKKCNSLVCKNGFAYLRGRLMRMMGKNATASCGAVIAHHQAPLGAVMRELRAAEQRAKTEAGRNAFSITVIKRSGGALQLTAKWGEPLAFMNDVRRFLFEKGVSRRAVYNTLEWLTNLPNPKENPQMLESLLAYQLARQAQGKELKKRGCDLASRLTRLASEHPGESLMWLANFLSVAEFLAREVRSGEGGAA